MLEIGRINTLQVTKQVSFGLYMDGGEAGEILLPKRYVPEGTIVQDWLDLFIYLDSEDRLIATTETPKVMVDECAFLKVVAVTPVGAFLDWGLPKDLLVPFNEQDRPMEVGRSYVVVVTVDDATNRIMASSRLHDYLDEEADEDIDVGQVEELSEKILQQLKLNNGTSQLTDKSPPEAIYRSYGVSKANYKRALSSLYKQRRILITHEEITLSEPE